MQMTGKYYAIQALLLPGRSEVSLSAIPLERNGIVRKGYCKATASSKVKVFYCINSNAKFTKTVMTKTAKQTTVGNTQKANKSSQ